MDFLIRKALVKEAPFLTSIALSSKAAWGYDENFMEQCRDELTLSKEYISSHEVYAAELGGQMIGFYGLIVNGSDAILDFLYVSPPFLRRGIGSKLWSHMIEIAKSRDVHSISIDADPHAEGFYQSMGARRIGSVPSGSIRDRVLPLMLFTL